jgi:hypothetical protein
MKRFKNYDEFVNEGLFSNGKDDDFIEGVIYKIQEDFDIEKLEHYGRDDEGDLYTNYVYELNDGKRLRVIYTPPYKMNIILYDRNETEEKTLDVSKNYIKKLYRLLDKKFTEERSQYGTEPIRRKGFREEEDE